jgi:signal transduction histidine kinase
MHDRLRPLATPCAVDAALAVALAAAAEAELAVQGGAAARPPAVLLALVMTLPLALRRPAPVAVAVVVAASVPLQRTAGVDMYNYLASVVAGLLAGYSVAAHAPLRRSLPAAFFLYGMVALGALRGASSLAWGLILIGGAALAGGGIRGRRLHAEQLALLAAELEAARDENARAAVTEERARIARELHDVVAHAVSVMVVQAGAAEQVLPAELSPARDALAAVQETGRQALVELRRLLGVLRADGQPATRGPQPGLAALEPLAQSVREAGLDVRVRVEGDTSAVGAGLDLAAYRIVQEALTNTLKHAQASLVEVAVDVDADELRLTVADDGRGSTNGGGRGHGLIGMRERALLYGGELEAGTRNGSGFAVHARLPLCSGR